jgi:hypothetical protein
MGLSLWNSHEPQNPKRVRKTTLLGELQLDDSALQRDHRGVGAVVGAKFGEDIPDLALDRFFADGKVRGYFFVCIPFRNQPQHPDFRGT